MSVSSPEKAGVGGSIPSLATMFSITYKPFLSDLFHYCSKTQARLVGTCHDVVRLWAVRPCPVGSVRSSKQLYSVDV